MAKIALLESKGKINICCEFFETIECGDDEEHKHIVCASTMCTKRDRPIINNDHAQRHCLSEEFRECPYHPEKGKTNSPAPAEVKVEIAEVLLSMHRGFIEDVKPTWEKWEKEATTTTFRAKGTSKAKPLY